MTVPASPPATRHRLPSWLDPRLALGVLLVVGSVLAGAAIVRSAHETTRVWAVRGDLAAGTVLAESQVRAVGVRLPENPARYLVGGPSPVGKTLSRDVGDGELLPRAALAPGPCGDRVSIPVAAQHVPAAIAVGQRVDVYSTPKGADPERVLAAVAVQDVRRSGSDWAVVVRVPADRAAEVVKSVRTAELDVVVVDTVARTTDACGADPARPAPSASPSPGGAPGEGGAVPGAGGAAKGAGR